MTHITLPLSSSLLLSFLLHHYCYSTTSPRLPSYPRLSKSPSLYLPSADPYPIDYLILPDTSNTAIMFMKQYNYKPRSGSQSGGTAGSPPKEPVKTASVTEQVQGASSLATKSPGRRRSSAGAEKFAGLSAHKRGSSDHGDRKASYADQKVGGSGILGGMWNSFTKGS